MYLSRSVTHGTKMTCTRVIRILIMGESADLAECKWRLERVLEWNEEDNNASIVCFISHHSTISRKERFASLLKTHTHTRILLLCIYVSAFPKLPT